MTAETSSFPSTVISVAGLYFLGGRLLLALRKDEGGSMDGRWELPGGKCENGESPETALVREWKEELLITVRVLGFSGSSEFTHRGVHHRLLGYRVQSREVPENSLLHDKIEWFSRPSLEKLLKNTPDLLVDSDRKLLKALLTQNLPDLR
ncbi:NUDIX domain-containing protein [Salinispira pacifica]|uniref:8-oxo-dGTP diphosphatase n=1 Tax=Salinispira pacifica TaxID=1307761 RepID=V5WHH9_9SPIO|nr:NUDIX domain-containing protein [Salinispira pacifica]AHC14621.1 Mutator mutT protein (7,8-dihydro-8-oxoguanine-triphosphatase) [Salinispira pacifica]